MTVDQALEDIAEQLDGHLAAQMFDNGTRMIAQGIDQETFTGVVQMQRAWADIERPRILAHCRRAIVATLEECRGASPQVAALIADADALIVSGRPEVLEAIDRLCVEAGVTPSDRVALDAFARAEMAASHQRLLDDLRARLTGVAG